MTIEVRPLGRSGLKVTAFGVGCATFGAATEAEEAHRILDTAYEGGIRFIDTADGYPSLPGTLGESERIVGSWLEARRVRDEVVLTTKVNYPMGPGPNDRGLSRGHLTKAVDASLARLRTDRIDLYQAHQFDPTTPVMETVMAFDSLVRSGKILYYGVANWPAWRVTEAHLLATQHGMAPPVALQTRYNLVARTVELEHVPACLEYGVGFVVFNALAGGVLTGRYRYDDTPGPETRFGRGTTGSTGRNLGMVYRQRYWSESRFDAVGELSKLCGYEGWTPIGAALGWLLAQPVVSCVLLGASKELQLRGQLSEAQTELSADAVARLGELWQPDPEA